MKQFAKNTMMHRRTFGKLSIVTTAIFAASALQFKPIALASATSSQPSAASSQQGSHMLINALKAIGKEATLAAAKRLEAHTSGAPFSLHLRNADLDASDANILASAMTNTGTNTRADLDADLRSFSVSFNPMLGDEGIIALAKSLPHSVREIGLVGCSMGDMGANALLAWAKQAPHLSMLCIEDNKLSTEAKQRFMDLRQQDTGLYIVV